VQQNLTSVDFTNGQVIIRQDAPGICFICLYHGLVACMNIRTACRPWTSAVGRVVCRECAYQFHIEQRRGSEEDCGGSLITGCLRADRLAHNSGTNLLASCTFEQAPIMDDETRAYGSGGGTNCKSGDYFGERALPQWLRRAGPRSLQWATCPCFVLEKDVFASGRDQGAHRGRNVHGVTLQPRRWRLWLGTLKTTRGFVGNVKAAAPATH